MYFKYDKDVKKLTKKIITHLYPPEYKYSMWKAFA